MAVSGAKSGEQKVEVCRSLKNRESMLAMWMSTQFVYALSKYSLEEILTKEIIVENGDIEVVVRW